MRAIRHIHSEDYPFSYVNVFVDKTRAVVRLLSDLKDVTDQDIELFGYKRKVDLLTMDKLADPHMNVCESLNMKKKNIFKIGDKFYFIAAERFFDKDTYPQKSSQNPISNITFVIDIRNERCLKVLDMGHEGFITKQRANEIAHNNGYTIPFQMYVRSPEDSVSIVSKSFASRPSCLITNVDMSKAIVQKPEDVDTDRRSSLVLQTIFTLYHPLVVKPNEEFTITVRAFDYWQNLADDLNYDNFLAEAVDGYLPHTRVKITNGVGQFRAIALGLKDGETMRVKFGRKFRTGLAECTIQIKE